MLIVILPLALVCHSDFSKANIDAPNGLLGHCRRVKKCLKEKERRNIVTLGLKMRKSSSTKGNPTFWDSVDSLRMMDEFPLKAYYLDRVMPEQPPLDLERESAFRPSNRTNHPSTGESPGHYKQTGESEMLDFEDDESQQPDDYDDVDHEAAQASPEARSRETYAFLPIRHQEQISGSASTRQQSVMNTPMGPGERSPSITTDGEFSPYSSGAAERALFKSPSYNQSCSSPLLVSGSGGPAPTAISVATVYHPSRPPQPTYHIEGAAHMDISLPATSTPSIIPVNERDIHMPGALITSPQARRANNNPPLTMTHSLPLPFHVSPPLNPLPRAAVLSDRSHGHGRTFFTSYRGSTGITDPPASSSQGDLYNGNLQTGSDIHHPNAKDSLVRDLLPTHILRLQLFPSYREKRCLAHGHQHRIHLSVLDVTDRKGT
ncbi:hypothetical protein FS837_009884 [Tulasnella sp. UAMH 9824]|nr:hypothetical protein FS837_009884 [Tulasnella sp. UAMH 9824]